MRAPRPLVVAVAVLGLAVGIGGSGSAVAAGPPIATVGMVTDSYTAARADFGLNLASEAGLASYDVRTSDSSMLAPRRAAWALRPGLQGVPTSGTHAEPRFDLPIARGRVLCVSVRVRDVEGVTGAWSEPACAIRALDDRSLARTGRTRVVRDSRYWGGRASEVGRRGRMLLRGVPAGSRLVVIATDLDQRSPRYNGRNLPFTVPSARSVRTCNAGWRWGPTRYTQVTTAGRPSGRYGTVVFRNSGYPRSSGYRWTSPLEGVAVQPRWL